MLHKRIITSYADAYPRSVRYRTLKPERNVHTLESCRRLYTCGFTIAKMFQLLPKATANPARDQFQDRLVDESGDITDRSTRVGICRRAG